MLQTFQVGQKFQGLKMIPPGVHFLSFCQLGQPGQLAPHHGMVLTFSESRVITMHWSKELEALVYLDSQDEVALNFP